MQKSNKERPTLEQLRAELLSLKAAIKGSLESLKAELAGLASEIREAGRED